MPFLNMTKFFLFTIISFSFLNCKSPTQYDKLNNYFKAKNEQINLLKFNTVIVVNETGTCPFCSSHFTNTVADYIDNKKILFIIACRGVQIDISPFIGIPQDNIIIDYNNDFSKLKLTESCSIIELAERKIDTIIEIQPENLQNSLDFFD